MPLGQGFVVAVGDRSTTLISSVALPCVEVSASLSGSVQRACHMAYYCLTITKRGGVGRRAPAIYGQLC